jgi:hypothetical protein
VNHLSAYGAGKYTRPIKQVVIVQRGTNATERHYLAPRLARCALPVVCWDLLADSSAPNLEDAYVIIVRYLDRAALQAIRTARPRLAGVAWLLDDDLAAASSELRLPLRYRYRMARFWLSFSRAIQDIASEIWLASDVLVERFASSEDSVSCFRIDPVADYGPAPVHMPHKPGEPVTVFYHGEITHRGECLWLKPILEDVQRRTQRARIEIIGHPDIGAAMHDVPRCSVIPPMPWQKYRAHIDGTRGDIGLAPLLPSRFNGARSFVKYLEIVRHGGVGLFAHTRVYRDVVVDAVNGRLLAMDRQLWAETILDLVEDDEERCRMRAGTLRRIPALTPPSLSQLVSAGT